MFGLTGTDMVKEIAEQTIFTQSALDKRDAQTTEGPLARLLNIFRQQNSADVSADCDDSPRLTNRLVDGVAHK